jgi:hypothetical protein
MIVADRKTSPMTGLMMVLAFSIIEIGDSGVFNNGMTFSPAIASYLIHKLIG